MGKASATEKVGSGSIPGRDKPETIKIDTIISLLDAQHWKRQCEVFTACDREVGMWQLDSETKEFFCYLVAKATCLITM